MILYIDTLELTNCIAVALSFIAIITSLITFLKSNKTNKNSCKPYLNVLYSFSDSETALVLRNVGMGSAIIKSIKFKKGNDTSTNIISLLSIKETFFCEYKDFPQNDYGVYVNETLVICKLRKSDFSNNDYDITTQQFKKDLQSISLIIEFKDIFDKDQINKEMNFKYLEYIKI